MYNDRTTPPPVLKRSHSGVSQNSHGSAATTVSRSSSKLLFGEIPLTPTTTVDGKCKQDPFAMRVRFDVDRV